MIKNFRIFSNQIYAGGAPSLKDLNYLKNILGVKAILSLDQQIAGNIAPAVEQLKIKHFIVPLTASPNISSDLKYLQRNIVNILSNNQPIYVHCLHGSDRTGLALALYRILKNNWTCKAAIAEAKRFQYGQRISQQTQKNWETFLCALTVDSNAIEDDITVKMRENFDSGNIAPAFNPQQSFAPFEFIDSSSFNKIDRSQYRQDLLREILHQQLPLIGLYNNLGPMRGFGPVENSGMLQLI